MNTREAPQTPRDPLLDAVRDAWTAWDPAPADLVDTVLIALAMDDLDTEYELLTLVSRHDHLAGTRSDSTDERVLIEFRSKDLSVLVRLSRDPSGAHRIDGWVTPASGGTVSILQEEDLTTIPLDPNGRFDVPMVKQGLTRLVVQPESIAQTPFDGEFRTTLFEI
ncbi:MAG: hypothetical protein ACLGHZ_00845 [Actinomycetes bacterium]